MAQFASDLFEGTEGAELSTYSAVWAKAPSVTGNIEIVSGAVRASSTTSASYYHSGTPASADYSVSANWSRPADVSLNNQIGVTARQSTSANTLYRLSVRPKSSVDNEAQIFRFVSGASTQLGSNIGLAGGTGNYALKLKVEGSQISGYWGGSETPFFDVTDASPITAAGKSGVRTYSGTAPTDANAPMLDNFSADDIASGITVLPSAGAISVSGSTPAISQPHTVAPSAGSAVYAGNTPTVSHGASVAPTAGALSITGNTPGISQPLTVSPAAGVVSLAGNAPEISQAASIRPSTGAVVFSGNVPTISQPRTIAPGIGGYDILGNTPTVSQAALISPVSGQIVVLGGTPAISQPRTVAPTLGAVVWIGNVPTIGLLGDPLVATPGWTVYASARNWTVYASARNWTVYASARNWRVQA